VQAFFDFIDEKAGNLQRHVDGWLCLLAGTVDKAWRNRGVAEILADETEEECTRKGYKGIEVICTSAYSSRLFAKRGYEHVLRYPYASYTDADGNQVFNPPPPHDAVNVYIK
ncbi:arylalkylamine N-acetyltransferase 1, partial [Halyomorpha halys]|uniref:arylalkylamine N-acetyltransferase 1 n=1 Tax=Halyomorpha halys TaxID=286706 RepID=UPI0034D20670